MAASSPSLPASCNTDRPAQDQQDALHGTERTQPESSYQVVLDQIRELDQQIGKEPGGFFGRWWQQGLEEKRKLEEKRNNLVTQLQVDVEVLRHRLARLEERIPERSVGCSLWFGRREDDSFLRAEKSALEEQLRLLAACLRELDADGAEVPPADVDRALGTLEEVDPGSELWRTLTKFVDERSKDFVGHYNYKMKVTRIWRVPMTEALQSLEQEASSLGRPTQLFHGTSSGSAAQIMEHGFKLPNHAGMFGKGIYFAETPLKSVKFAREDLLQVALDFLFGLASWIIGIEGTRSRPAGSNMLLCDVYLGRTRTKRVSCNRFDPSNDLKGGLFSSMFNLGDYDSLYCPGGIFSAVRVTEFVVYRPCQAIPRYQIEFDRCMPWE